MKKKLVGIPKEVLLSIKELFENSSIESLSSKNNEYSISISRKKREIQQNCLPLPKPLPSPKNIAPPKECQGDPYGSSDYIKIKAPVRGIFYDTPAPDSEPFVKIGQKISPGMTICIIEAMKVFNEIKAKESGTLITIEKSRGDLISTNEILFILKK